jgi:multicomponent Na+:H+ antiporter subunit B
MTEPDLIERQVISLLYPLMLLFAFAVILNGHRTPGGGFQGGAILATVLISRYLVHPHQDIRIKTLQSAEKILFIGIVLLPALLLLSGFVKWSDATNQIYLITMNSLIGLKVGAGLTSIFFRFTFFEGGL